MHSRTWAAVILAVAVAIPASTAAAAADEATLLRVFLTDGTSLISYGEPARVNDRVIFSMPTSSSPNPPLHLVNLPANRVDWDRTSRYAATARSSHYLQTQAENDYAALSNDVASTLNEVTQTADPSQRLAIVQRARQTLSDWPQTHYNYRAVEVRQMIGMLDEAIADLQASRTPGHINLTLSAYADPLAIVEPLLPPPTPQQAIEQVLAAARAVDMSAERTSLLASAVASIDLDKDALPGTWVATTRAKAEAELAKELRLDRTYQTLTRRMMTLANRRSKQANAIAGLERLVRTIRQRDAALGAKRPDTVNSLIDAVQIKLDAARQLKLARARFATRAAVMTQYRLAIRVPMDLFTQLKPSLEAVKALSGSNPAALAGIQRSTTRILTLVSEIAPPDELVAAHSLLVSAVQLAGNAAQIRREATLAKDMTRAWDASSAAAGALMLGARARSDIQSLSRPPQPK
jgi:hypothetical protein